MVAWCFRRRPDESVVATYMNLSTSETTNSTLGPGVGISNELKGLSFILVSPNVSEQMGGEAIKSLQICLELTLRGARVHQVTHERVKAELSRNFPGISVSYVKDTWLQKLAYRCGMLNPLVGAVISSPIIAIIFQRRAVRLVQAQLRERPESIVHFTSPVAI